MNMKISVISATQVRVYGASPKELGQNYRAFMEMIGWNRFKSAVHMQYEPVGSNQEMQYFHTITLTAKA